MNCLGTALMVIGLGSMALTSQLTRERVNKTVRVGNRTIGKYSHTLIRLGNDSKGWTLDCLVEIFVVRYQQSLTDDACRKTSNLKYWMYVPLWGGITSRCNNGVLRDTFIDTTLNQGFFRKSSGTITIGFPIYNKEKCNLVETGCYPQIKMEKRNANVWRTAFWDGKCLSFTRANITEPKRPPSPLLIENLRPLDTSISMEAALRQMSSDPAPRFGLRRRRSVAPVKEVKTFHDYFGSHLSTVNLTTDCPGSSWNLSLYETTCNDPFWTRSCEALKDGGLLKAVSHSYSRTVLGLRLQLVRFQCYGYFLKKDNPDLALSSANWAFVFSRGSKLSDASFLPTDIAMKHVKRGFLHKDRGEESTGNFFLNLTDVSALERELQLDLEGDFNFKTFVLRRISEIQRSLNLLNQTIGPFENTTIRRELDKLYVRVGRIDDNIEEIESHNKVFREGTRKDIKEIKSNITKLNRKIVLKVNTTETKLLLLFNKIEKLYFQLNESTRNETKLLEKVLMAKINKKVEMDDVEIHAGMKTTAEGRVVSHVGGIMGVGSVGVGTITAAVWRYRKKAVSGFKEGLGNGDVFG